MVIGFHVILTAYGFWLPNDPRGSWSDFVGAWELVRFGRATKTDERRSLAGEPHDRRTRVRAKQVLKYPAVRFTGRQARAIGRGFDALVNRSALSICACSILPEHTHLVVGQHRYPIEQIANLLKGAATRQLMSEGLHPFGALREKCGRLPHAWARGLWKVFLGTPADVRRAVRYVEDNPSREGLPRQRWAFVTPFDVERSGL
jgi:REP element-mobilizing transposase RayT